MENCFAEARTYEYALPVTGEELISRLEGFEVKENHSFRRPVFSAKRGALEIKGILKADVVKINYTAENWEKEKKEMEEWLEEQDVFLPGVTESLCPVCLETLPARKAVRDSGIYLVKECPEHGRYEALIWEGSAESYLAWGEKLSPADRIPGAGPVRKGCPLDCGLCEAHERRGCCVLLEVTGRCNLRCPVCFAESGPEGRDVPLEELKRQLEYLMEHGGPFNIQLSGGEPTVREDLEEIIRLGRDTGFSFFQLNTNGIRLAEEPGYALRLKKAGLSCVFLQFDGMSDDVYRTLRGRALLDSKLRAIDACEAAGLGVVLVPVVVPGVNEDQVGKILALARSRMPAVRGVHFQPVSYFGRCREADGSYRITIPKMLALMEEQTDGWIRAGDFTGGNATNPYCTFQANYLRGPDGAMRLQAHGETRNTGVSEQARDAVARQWSGAESGCCCSEGGVSECCGGEGSASECCGSGESGESGRCCGEELSALTLDTSSLDEFLAERHRNTLAISGMVFQDAWNLELERLKRCYILESDSRYGMVPFCIYNLTGADGRTVYR